MSDLVEDDIMGEDLDYEEYDLDEEEEEALLAESEERNFASKHEPIHLSGGQDEENYSQVTIMDHLDEEDDGTIEEEEEEEDDDYDSTSRDRFKSERTKVSLPDSSKFRNIPDSLDDVQTTETSQGNNQRRGFSKRPRFFRQQKPNSMQNRMRNQHGYQNFGNFDSWERPPLMSLGLQGHRRPPFSPIMGMHHLRGPPMRLPPSAYGMMQDPMHPYMMNAPQIPRASFKRNFSEMNANDTHPKLTRIVQNSPKTNNKQPFQNRVRPTKSNPNLTVINTVELPTTDVQMPKKKLKKATIVAPVAVVGPKLSPEDAEYERKLMEQKKKREEILAKKEKRRQEAARQAQLAAPPVPKTQVAAAPPVIKLPAEKTRHTPIQRKPERMHFLDVVHDPHEQSDARDDFEMRRPYPESPTHRRMGGEPQRPFALRSLGGPPIGNPRYNPPINTSLPPPHLSRSSPLPLRVVSRPPGHPPFIPPSGPPPRLMGPISREERPFTRNLLPDRPPPVVSAQPFYPATRFNQRSLAPHVPPPMTPRFSQGSAQLAPPLQAPTITLNFPPPPITVAAPQAPPDYFYDRAPTVEYDEEPRWNQYGNRTNFTRPVASPETNTDEDAAIVQRYKWKNQLNPPVRTAPTGSNIIINTSPKRESQPIKKVKKFKRIIRKNKNGDVLLIKKLVLDEDGNPTGVEEVEFIHEDVIAETAAIKRLTTEKNKRKELVQQRGSISNKHFRGADHIPVNRLGEAVRKTTYSKLDTTKPSGKRVVTSVAKGRPTRPVRYSSHTVMLSKIPSNVSVIELKDLADDEGLEVPASILYDKAEKKCSFEFANQEVAFKFCKKMNGRMLKMSIIHAAIV